MGNELVCLKEYLNRVEAEFAKSAIDRSRIDSYIAADDAGGMRPALSFVSPVRLMVRKEDVDEALEMLGKDS